MAHLPPITDITDITGNAIQIDDSGALLVCISTDQNTVHLRTSPESTVVFRDKECTINEIISYVEELENSLAEAHLTSKE